MRISSEVKLMATPTCSAAPALEKPALSEQLAEHLRRSTPLNTLLAAAGLTSLRSLEGLIADHAPARPDDVEAVARQLGAIEQRRSAKCQHDAVQRQERRSSSVSAWRRATCAISAAQATKASTTCGSNWARRSAAIVSTACACDMPAL